MEEISPHGSPLVFIPELLTTQVYDTIEQRYNMKYWKENNLATQ
jgi:hypothetical protein